ncbi:uncharacterized protein MONOS_12152 [Monocercomonoides exilis]|uniref:uncharacterized protein n=1 Tax=Monocercomonoides exilis TaxID=2049356 RepID=UPI003559C38A|nr:hypothetical protein MONOS_12152 [Monocercomonoides exilis]|eukprot:MONOS_12152.1-p1 / transcript=MONOS_12152.1 / gene=MONOS_12152 / organism=Monocercomonoides_exilis_PA203 / gene_product=unspecified product / transcript_product=unspecified product / location=Mono_scaffold00653:8951-12348(-) / protein_length=1077 / sequence_SO=supercontig / SO=protein_coding / is_pseudo=false
MATSEASDKSLEEDEHFQIQESNEGIANAQNGFVSESTLTTEEYEHEKEEEQSDSSSDLFSEFESEDESNSDNLFNEGSEKKTSSSEIPFSEDVDEQKEQFTVKDENFSLSENQISSREIMENQLSNLSEINNSSVQAEIPENQSQSIQRERSMRSTYKSADEYKNLIKLTQIPTKISKPPHVKRPIPKSRRVNKLTFKTEDNQMQNEENNNIPNSNERSFCFRVVLKQKQDDSQESELLPQPPPLPLLPEVIEALKTFNMQHNSSVEDPTSQQSDLFRDSLPFSFPLHRKGRKRGERKSSASKLASSADEQKVPKRRGRKPGARNTMKKHSERGSNILDINYDHSDLQSDYSEEMEELMKTRPVLKPPHRQKSDTGSALSRARAESPDPFKDSVYTPEYFNKVIKGSNGEIYFPYPLPPYETLDEWGMMIMQKKHMKKLQQNISKANSSSMQNESLQLQSDQSSSISSFSSPSSSNASSSSSISSTSEEASNMHEEVQRQEQRANWADVPLSELEVTMVPSDVDIEKLIEEQILNPKGFVQADCGGEFEEAVNGGYEEQIQMEVGAKKKRGRKPGAVDKSAKKKGKGRKRIINEDEENDQGEAKEESTLFDEEFKVKEEQQMDLKQERLIGAEKQGSEENYTRELPRNVLNDFSKQLESKQNAICFGLPMDEKIPSESTQSNSSNPQLKTEPEGKLTSQIQFGPPLAIPELIPPELPLNLQADTPNASDTSDSDTSHPSNSPSYSPLPSPFFSPPSSASIYSPFSSPFGPSQQDIPFLSTPLGSPNPYQSPYSSQSPMIPSSSPSDTSLQLPPPLQLPHTLPLPLQLSASPSSSQPSTSTAHPLPRSAYLPPSGIVTHQMSNHYSTIFISRATDKWFTPPDIIASIVEMERRPIDLDPASEPAAQRIVGARQFWCASALEKSWNADIVYVNPPFSLIGVFMNHALNEYTRKHCKELFVLCRAAPSSRWFDIAFHHPHCHTLFFSHRLKFWENTGDGSGDVKTASSSMPHEISLFYFGKKSDAFLTKFRKYGITYPPWVVMEREIMEMENILNKRENKLRQMKEEQNRKQENRIKEN